MIIKYSKRILCTWDSHIAIIFQNAEKSLEWSRSDLVLSAVCREQSSPIKRACPTNPEEKQPWELLHLPPPLSTSHLLLETLDGIWRWWTILRLDELNVSGWIRWDWSRGCTNVVSVNLTCHIARKYCTVSQMLEEEKTKEHRWRLKRKQHFLYISASLSHRLHILVIELWWAKGEKGADSATGNRQKTFHRRLPLLTKYRRDCHECKKKEDKTKFICKWIKDGILWELENWVQLELVYLNFYQFHCFFAETLQIVC